MKLVNRLEQWTLYPMMVLWVAAFIVGLYDAYRLWRIIYKATASSAHRGQHAS